MERRWQELKEEFTALLKGKFNRFPEGEFVSKLSGVESISILRGIPVDNEVKSLLIYLWYQDRDGKRKSAEFILDENGRIYGKIPWYLETFKGIEIIDVYEEIIRIVKTLNLDFFTSISEEILPPEKIFLELETKEQKQKREAGEKIYVDPRRLEFLEKQPDALFGVVGANSGFRGYYGIVFPWGLILENPRIGNALYIVPFKPPIKPEDPRIFKLPPEKRLTSEEREQIIEERIKPLTNLTKSEIVQRGAIRIIHPPVTSKEWEEKMTSVISEYRK